MAYKNTLQTVFQLGFKDYAAQHRLPLHYHQAASHILSCRTAALGGHSVYCDNHHLNGVWYNSCKHRACPQCNGVGLYRWVEQQKARLLDCPHLHLIFPLPHEYLDYRRFNTVTLMRLMFQAAKESLQELLMTDPARKYLDAQPGFILVLHTWGRDLALHPHLHGMLTQGGLKDSVWVTQKGSVLLPARVLRAKYQGKLNALIRQSARRTSWQYFPGQGLQPLVNLSHKVGRKKWQVYIKEQLNTTGPLLTYLVNYLRGGPLKNPQITAVNRRQVTFKYYPHRTNPDGKKKQAAYRTQTLDVFFQRYLQHLPPTGQMTVRYYGLYANANRARLNQARHALGQVLLPVGKHDRGRNEPECVKGLPNWPAKLTCGQCQQPVTVLKGLPRLTPEQFWEQVHGPP